MRSRTLRKLAAIATLTVAASTLAACGESEDAKKEELLEIIAATRSLAKQFVYVDQPASGTEISVVGVFEDSLQFKARLSVNGQAVKEEVAVDDALAVRFLDTGRVGLFIDEEKVADATKAPAAEPGAPPQPTPLDALTSGRWVLDPTGAPSLVPRADDERTAGEDPVLDALAVLDYVARVVDAFGVVRYNKDALEPVYKPNEDHFPKPSQGAAITRYDVPLRRFPKASEQGGKNVVIVPGVENFRKLSIFVKDDRVIEIREDIDVESRMDDLKRNFDVRTDFTVEQAVLAINEVRKSKGEDPFRPRRMQVEFDFDSTQDVSLPPASTTLRATLSFLRYRGASLPKKSTASATGSTASTTSTSTVEPLDTTATTQPSA